MEALKLYRERAGLTQTQLAEMAGVGQHHVSRWETGRTKPSRHSLERVAGALGVTEWDLRYAQELLDRREAVERTVEGYALAG